MDEEASDLPISRNSLIRSKITRFRIKIAFISVVIIIFVTISSNSYFQERIFDINQVWYRAIGASVRTIKPFGQSQSETSIKSDDYFVQRQFGRRFDSHRSSFVFNYSESLFRSSSSPPILWIDAHGDVRWNEAAESEMRIYLSNKQKIEGNKSEDEIIDDCLHRRFFVIKQHFWGFFSRYHCFIEQFGQTLYSPWMTLLSYNRFIIPQPHEDDFHHEGILRYFQPISICSKYLRDPRMKLIQSKLRDDGSKPSYVTSIRQLLYNHWFQNKKFIILNNDRVWHYGYEHAFVRQWIFSRNQVNPTYDLPIKVLINHNNEHIYRSPTLTDDYLAQWLPRNRPWEQSKYHLPGNRYKLTWQDHLFTGFLRYMFVLYFHHFAPRIEQMTHLLAEHWSTYLFDKEQRNLNETAAIFIRRGDKMIEDSFWKKHEHWRNISFYVKGLVDEEQRLNRIFSSIFIMTDDVSVMESIKNYADPKSNGNDEIYARKHLRNRQILYNVFAPQACFNPFNRIGFDQFLVSTEFIIRYVQFTVSHTDSNVGRYLEEIIYTRHQLKFSVQSNSFVRDAPDSF